METVEIDYSGVMIDEYPMGDAYLDGEPIFRYNLMPHVPDSIWSFILAIGTKKGAIASFNIKEWKNKQ